METTPTKAPENENNSVYIADKDVVRLYPRDMSNDQIDYDIQTSVREKTPDDYYSNFLPLRNLQQAWRMIDENKGVLTEAVGKSPAFQVASGISDFLRKETEEVDPAMKLIVSDPTYALGFTKDENNPDNVANTYKPWLQLWRESTVGKKLTSVSDEALANKPLPIAAIPWFVTEFVPDQLLQFGTRASNWAGAYGIQKFGPPIINSVLSKLPEPVRNVLLKDLFKAEMSLADDFATLGVSPNTKTSQVHSAYIKASKVTHPDLGGNPEEFVQVKSAYDNIMRSRASWYDKMFDYFRGAPEFKASQTGSAGSRGVIGLLGNEKGSAMIPFQEGDIVRAGESIGKIVKITGEIAEINVAGKVKDVALSKLSKLMDIDPKDAAVNLKRFNIGEEGIKTIEEATAELGKKLPNQGKPLSHEEIIKASEKAGIISEAVSRDSTLQFEAALLNTRKQLAALAEKNEITPEFLDTLKVVSSLGTDIARNLESFKINALPEAAQVKIQVIKDMQKLGIASEDILKAANGVDFNDEQSVAKFYRKFVKPKLSEILDEYVYMNILSSPVTHIVNSFSNFIQLAGLNPLTRLASGGIDYLASQMTGKERAHYVLEVPAFYKGALNAFPKAWEVVMSAMKGKKHLERPDIKRLPTLSKWVDWGTLKIGKYVPRALEASDILFRTMIEGGEIEALSKRLGHEPDAVELAAIKKKAKENADYYVFRSRPDEKNTTGQGYFLSAIDDMTNAMYRLRAVPGMKWFIRFVQTPMNILKQGVEFSPLGVATLPGNKDKVDQAAKIMVGSFVFAGASYLAANNRTTWSAPTSEREKNEFYAAGLQPYSIRMGDKWVSYSKLGPLSYPMAMASALHYFTKESPNALSDSDMDKIVDAMTGLMKFFSDQSYMQGLGDLVSFARGEKTKAIASIPTQLIPLSSLQGWVNNIIDPLQRKAEKGLSIQSVVDQIQMKIVGMSQFVPPQMSYEEVPVKKQMRGVNAVSPMRMSKADKGKTAEYKETQRMKQEVNLAKKQGAS